MLGGKNEAGRRSGRRAGSCCACAQRCGCGNRGTFAVRVRRFLPQLVARAHLGELTDDTITFVAD